MTVCSNEKVMTLNKVVDIVMTLGKTSDIVMTLCSADDIVITKICSGCHSDD